MNDNPCSLQPRQLSQRIEQWRRLQPAIVGAERTAAGARVRYRVEPGVADELLELVEAERRCCPDLSFSVELTLDVSAPEELRGWVADTFGLDAGQIPPVADDPQRIEEAVRQHYAAVAEGASCCGPTSSCGSRADLDTIGAGLYPPADLDALPVGAVVASAGCANPITLAELTPGETVLDLGSGGGIDVLLSARRVGPTGKVYGLDMTDEMLALAGWNKAKAGARNVEFLKGRIEDVPLPSAAVDVIVSNCVIALSTDKAAVFAEAHRVLKVGGRLAIADVVADDEAPPDRPEHLAKWVSCTAGALTRGQYRSGLKAAGFEDVSVTEGHRVADGFTSVIVSAVKDAT